MEDFIITAREQEYFEDVEAGSALEPLVKEPLIQARTMMVAAVLGGFAPTHIDCATAKAWLNWDGAYAYAPELIYPLSQLMTDWIGTEGTLKKLSAYVKAPAYVKDGVVEVGDVLTAKGTVTKKYVKDDENYVECKLWVEKQDGTVCVDGSAMVTLPSRR